MLNSRIFETLNSWYFNKTMLEKEKCHHNFASQDLEKLNLVKLSYGGLVLG